MRSDFVEQYNGSNEPVPLNSMSRKRYRIVILCMVWLQLTLLCMLFCNQALLLMLYSRLIACETLCVG